MITTTVPSDSGHQRLLLRGLAAASLAGIALIHLEQLPETWRQTPLLGAMYAVLIVAATAAAIAAVSLDRRLLWLAVFLIAAGPVGGYALTRSQAVFFDDQDVGNWLEPPGLVSLFVEISLMAMCIGLMLRRPVRTPAGDPGAAMVAASSGPRDGRDGFAGTGGFIRSPEAAQPLETAEPAGRSATQ